MCSGIIKAEEPCKEDGERAWLRPLLDDQPIPFIVSF